MQELAQQRGGLPLRRPLQLRPRQGPAARPGPPLREGRRLPRQTALPVRTPGGKGAVNLLRELLAEYLSGRLSLSDNSHSLLTDSF